MKLLTIRNRKLWNLFPFFNRRSIVPQEPIYLSFASSIRYSITENTRQSLREIDFVQTTEQMHLSLTLPLLCVSCIFYPLNLANRHLSCVRFVPISFSFHDKLIVPVLAGKSILYNLINDRSEGWSLVTSKLSYSSR